MTNKTALDGEGIFQLGLIQDFFKKMKIPISKIKIIGDYFDLDCHYNRNFRREILRNSFEYFRVSAIAMAPPSLNSVSKFEKIS